MKPYLFIVNSTVGPQGPGAVGPTSAYFYDESDAAQELEDVKSGVGEDGLYVELVRVDLKTLESTVITGWEGTIEDLEDESEE